MADYVHIFDTTLRDGEQSPGCSMNVAEKLQVARMLDELGVDVMIENPNDSFLWLLWAISMDGISRRSLLNVHAMR